MSKNKDKRKGLGAYITKKYISTSFLILFLCTVFASIGIEVYQYAALNKILNNLSARNIVCADYENIDVSYLDVFEGWLEILDEDNRVIYTKGTVREETEVYTQMQLLEQASTQNVFQDRGFSLGFISIQYNEKEDRSPYLANYAGFEDTYGNQRICVVKYNSDTVQMNSVTIKSNSRLVLTTVFSSIILILLGGGIILTICLRRYSRSVRYHITEPNRKLVSGLRKVTSGDYSARLFLEAEHEYMEIEESFNILVEELETAKRQREMYEAERQLLFANIAHDLRTPITTIAGFARVVEDGLTDSPEKISEYMETILGKTEHMKALIEKLLTYVKLESNDYFLKLQDTDFAELVRQVVADHWGEAEAQGMEPILDIPENIIPVRVDIVEMRRVLDNLMVNAIRHNPAGTVIKISLRIEKLKASSKVVLELEDNGAPIPAELRYSIFQPFVCGDESRTSKNGSGLGLSICKKIIEKHRGELALVAKDDGWKAFRITLSHNPV